MAMTDGGLLSARSVHIDQSDLGAIRRLYDDLPPGEGAKHDGKHRWAIVNLWRPLNTVTRDNLACCDARTVEEQDLAAVYADLPKDLQNAKTGYRFSAGTKSEAWDFHH